MDERVENGLNRFVRGEFELFGDPRDAVATEEELDYLLDLVGDVFPDIPLSRSDVQCHYSGVRPLPHVDTSTTAAVTRDHSIEVNEQSSTPVYTLIGGWSSQAPS